MYTSVKASKSHFEGDGDIDKNEPTSADIIKHLHNHDLSEKLASNFLIFGSMSNKCKQICEATAGTNMMLSRVWRPSMADAAMRKYAMNIMLGASIMFDNREARKQGNPTDTDWNHVLYKCWLVEYKYCQHE